LFIVKLGDFRMDAVFQVLAFGEKLLVELIPRGFMLDPAFLCEVLERGREAERMVGLQARALVVLPAALILVVIAEPVDLGVALLCMEFLM